MVTLLAKLTALSILTNEERFKGENHLARLEGESAEETKEDEEEGGKGVRREVLPY